MCKVFYFIIMKNNKKKYFDNNNQYDSSLGTKITINQNEAGPTILKETKLNSSFFGHEKKLILLIEQYADRLRSSKIKIPIVYEIYFKNNSIFSLCEFAGESILELMNSRKIEHTILKTNIFQQILEILKSVQISKIDFDPHPKNYVLRDGKLSYVDFTPPWLPEYYELRIEKANSNEIDILNDFFSCMHYKEMGYHLAGDLIKIDKNNVSHLPLIYEEMKKIKLIDKDYGFFQARSKLIIRKEREREEQNIFLL